MEKRPFFRTFTKGLSFLSKPIRYGPKKPILAKPAEAWVRDKWMQFFGGGNARMDTESDNIVFNEYQQTQYDRIYELKEEIKKRAESFRAFRFDAKRRQDQQEFEAFMANNPQKGQGGA